MEQKRKPTYKYSIWLSIPAFVLLAIDTIKHLRAYGKGKGAYSQKFQELRLGAIGNLLLMSAMCLVTMFIYGLMFFLILMDPEARSSDLPIIMGLGLLAGLYVLGVMAAHYHARWRVSKMAHILPTEEVVAATPAHALKIPLSQHGNVLRINQTKTIFPAEFEVLNGETLTYVGQYSRISGVTFAHTLRDKGGSLVYETQDRTFTNLMLFSHLKPLSRVCTVVNSRGEEVASFARVRDGFASGYYAVQYKSMDLKLYDIGKGINEYVLIFLNDRQIGQICKKNVIYDNLDWYVLFLLEEYKDMAPLLSLFTLYFDGFHHLSRVGSQAFQTKKRWSFHKYGKLYDPEWLKRHFENRGPFS